MARNRGSFSFPRLHPAPSQCFWNGETCAGRERDRLRRQLFELLSARFATAAPSLPDYGGGAQGHEKPRLCRGRKPSLKLIQSPDERLHRFAPMLSHSRSAATKWSVVTPSRVPGGFGGCPGRSRPLFVFIA